MGWQNTVFRGLPCHVADRDIDMPPSFSEAHSSARSSAQIVSLEAALGALGPTKVGTRPPSTWRIVQSEIAAKDLLLLVGAALRRRRFHECDRRWRQRYEESEVARTAGVTAFQGWFLSWT